MVSTLAPILAHTFNGNLVEALFNTWTMHTTALSICAPLQPVSYLTIMIGHSLPNFMGL